MPWRARRQIRLRIKLPAGLVWGEEAGQILLHPDEAVRGAISAVLERLAATGSARHAVRLRSCRKYLAPSRRENLAHRAVAADRLSWQSAFLRQAG